MTNQNAAVPLGEDGDIEKLRELSDAAPAGPFEAWGDDIGHASGEGPVLASAHRPGLAQFLAGSINYVRAALARANNTDPVRALIAKWRRQAAEHGTRTFTGNDHAMFANELEAALASAPPAEAQTQGGATTPGGPSLTEIGMFLKHCDPRLVCEYLDDDVNMRVAIGVHLETATIAPPSAPVGGDNLVGLLGDIRDLLASLPVDCLGSDTDASGHPYSIRDEVIHGITTALAQQPAAPSGEAVGSDGRRERLLERRTALNNSFGNGAYEDGRVQQQIDAIDAELAALATPQQPAAPSGEAGQWVACCPALLIAGVSCARTPRREGSDGRSHEHFIAHAAPQQPAAVDGVVGVLLEKSAALEKVLPVSRDYAHAYEVHQFRAALTAALAAQQQGGRADG